MGALIGRWWATLRRALRLRPRRAAEGRAPTAAPPLSQRLGPDGPTPPRTAYLVSVFPSLTETFILYEFLAMEKLGMDVTLYSLQRDRPPVVQPEAAALLPRVRFHRFVSWPILGAQVYFLRRAPGAYFAALWTWLCATWGSLRYFSGALVFFPKTVYFARHMKAEGITHLHAHFASHPAAAAFVIRRLTGIPYSFAAHGSDLHRERRMLREKVAEAAFVVTCAEFNKEWIVRECGESCRDKLVVIRYGVDPAVFCPPRTPRPRSSGPPSIYCVGTLYEVKGQRVLIEACERLRQRGIAFCCHFVGDGPDGPLLARLADQLDLAASIRFHGRQTRDEVAALLQEAQVLVCPSIPSRDGRREGMPNVLIEAMAAGVPVVASRLSGIPELVLHERTGLLFPPGDSQALAEALQQLIADPGLRRQLAQAGRAKVLEEYDRVKNCMLLARCIETARSATLPP